MHLPDTYVMSYPRKLWVETHGMATASGDGVGLEEETRTLHKRGDTASVTLCGLKTNPMTLKGYKRAVREGEPCSVCRAAHSGPEGQEVAADGGSAAPGSAAPGAPVVGVTATEPAAIINTAGLGLPLQADSVELDRFQVAALGIAALGILGVGLLT